MGYCDYTDAWLIALTRERRAELAARRARPEPLRFTFADGERAKRDRHGARAWKVRQWRSGNRRCGYCGVRMRWKAGSPDSATVDHREPWRAGFGGLDGPLNWLMACFACNNRKANLSEAEFRAILATD